MEEWLSTSEVAKELGINPATVRERCKDGSLECLRTIPDNAMGKIRITRKSLEDFKKKCEGAYATDNEV